MAILPVGCSASLRALLIDHVRAGATVITDGWQPPSSATCDLYVHERLAGAARPTPSQLLAVVHRSARGAERWLLGTQQGAVEDSHLTSLMWERRGSRFVPASQSWYATAPTLPPPLRDRRQELEDEHSRVLARAVGDHLPYELALRAAELAAELQRTA